MKQFAVGLFFGALFFGAFATISATADARARPKERARPIILDPPGRARILYTDTGCGYLELARTEFVVGGDR